MDLSCPKHIIVSILCMSTLISSYGQTNNLSDIFLEFTVDNIVVRLPFYASYAIEAPHVDIERLAEFMQSTITRRS